MTRDPSKGQNSTFEGSQEQSPTGWDAPKLAWVHSLQNGSRNHVVLVRPRLCYYLS